MALTIAGDLCFDPLRDTLVNAKGEVVKLSEPVGEELPAHGFIGGKEGYIAPGKGQTEITVNPHSQRLQLLTPFPAWDGMDLLNMPLLIKVQGKCTTDHISMAGPWLRFRGHLENISDNMLMGAVNVSMERRIVSGIALPIPMERCQARRNCINPKASLPLSLPKRIMVKVPAVSMLPWNHAS